jgi:hypothetical protein
LADREGDPTKQPPECKSIFTPHPDPRPPGAVGEGTWSKCPHIKETGGGMEGEQYSCDVCGKRYFLDYDDMR